MGFGPDHPVPAELLRSFAGRRTGGFRETSACHEPAGLRASDSEQRGRAERRARPGLKECGQRPSELRIGEEL